MAYAEKRISTAKGSKGKVTWRSRYKKPDGTWGSEPGFPTKKTAENWGDEQEAAIRAGRWIDPGKARTPFGAWAREWMTTQSPRGATIDDRWGNLQRHILPRWETTPLCDINWFDTETWSHTLAAAETVISNILTLMSQIMNGAVDAKYITVNPLSGRRRRKTTCTRTPQGPRKQADEDKWATPEVVLQLAQRLGPRTGLHVLTTAWTGLRSGESLGLNRCNTLLRRRQAHEGGYFECPVIRVHPEVGTLAEYTEREPDGTRKKAVRVIEPPKNRASVRDIDLPPFLAELLEKHLANWPYDYVFCRKDGDWWWRSGWTRVLRPAADGRPHRKAAGGAPERVAWDPIMPGLTMRDLRHTHDTWQSEDNVNPVLAHEQAGHKYPGIKGTYQHPTPAMRLHRLEAFESRYWRAMHNLGIKELWL